MRRKLGLLGVILLVSGAGVASSVAGEPSDAKEPPVPACITYKGEARPRYPGYDHIVHIKSTCTKTADCVVSTDVAPEQLKAVVPAGAKVEVFTFLQSPAFEFTPKVTCKLRP
jgi:hypothetical protein